MIDPIVIRPLIAALGIVLMTAPMGCLVIWRRLAFVGDTLAHASLLGVALAVMLKVPLMPAVFVFCALVALILFMVLEDQRIATDSSLSIISYGALAFGLVLFSKMPGPSMDPSHVLFGDILFVARQDVWLILGAVIVVGIYLWAQWRALIIWIMSPELAHALNISTRWLRLSFILVLAMVIALALKIAGVLLAPALLVIPPAAVASWVKTPNQMMGWSIVVAISMVFGGFYASLYGDLPTGPSIVAIGSVIFIVLLALRRWRHS